MLALAYGMQSWQFILLQERGVGEEV